MPVKLMVRLSVMVLSQPAAFGITAVYAPVVVYVWLFTGQVYESSAVWDIELEVLVFIVRFRACVTQFAVVPV
jgi:hypothetical protein